MPTILVVEEDQVVRGLMRVILEGAGYRVIEAGNGDAGFQLALRSAVDAVVLDCMGRLSNGTGMLRRLRGEPRMAHLPVIALSGLGQSGIEVGLWANALLVKPFRPAQLLMNVQMALSSTLPSIPTAESGRAGASA